MIQLFVVEWLLNFNHVAGLTRSESLHYDRADVDWSLCNLLRRGICGQSTDTGVVVRARYDVSHAASKSKRGHGLGPF